MFERRGVPSGAAFCVFRVIGAASTLRNFAASMLGKPTQTHDLFPQSVEG